MKKLSKRMATLSTKIEDRIYAPLEALSIIKENANAKFDETIEAHIRLGIDPKYRKRIPENGIIRKLKFNQLV
jgi:large subunit ribosomal protein L1